MANVIVNNIGDLNGALAEANASTTTPFQIQFGSDITGSPTVEVAGTIIQIVGNGHTFDANGGILLLIGPFGGVVDFDNTLAITLGGNEEEVGGQGTVTIAGVISDQTGSVGSLTINPVPIADPVVLSAVNTYTGGTTIESGTLQLTAGATAGSGPITFGSLGVGRFLPTLQIDAPVSGNQMFTNTLVNMMVGDRIDLLGVPFGTAQPHADEFRADGAERQWDRDLQAAKPGYDQLQREQRRRRRDASDDDAHCRQHDARRRQHRRTQCRHPGGRQHHHTRCLPNRICQRHQPRHHGAGGNQPAARCGARNKQRFCQRPTQETPVPSALLKADSATLAKFTD